MTFNYTNSYFITFDNAFDRVKNVKIFGEYLDVVVKSFDSSFWAQHDLWPHKVRVMREDICILYLEKYDMKNSYRIQITNTYRTNIYIMIRLINQIITDYNARIKNSGEYIECIPKVGNYLEFLKTIFSGKDKVNDIYKSDRLYYPSAFFFSDKKYNNFA